MCYLCAVSSLEAGKVRGDGYSNKSLINVGLMCIKWRIVHDLAFAQVIREGVLRVRPGITPESALASIYCRGSSADEVRSFTDGAS